jgi:putative NADH-flavin reductase
MKIALYGATGMIGQQIAKEALQRGHDVTAIVRDPARLALANDHLTAVTGDVTDAVSVAQSVAGHDAVVVSISGRRDGDNGIFFEAFQAVLSGLTQAGVSRLGWVGGASSLEVAPGLRLLDTPEFPEIYKSEATPQAELLPRFRTEVPANIDWFFVSPAAEIAPGERTSTFRLGGDQLLTDANGKSFITVEDFAVAFVDELEKHQHSRQRFTVAY